MFVAGNFVAAVAIVLNALISALGWLILVRVLLSWVNADPYNPIVQMLHAVTEPVLAPIRRMLPPALRTGLDVSPVIAFVLLLFLQAFAVSTLHDIARLLR